MKTITLEGGIKVGIFTEPPAGFDPFTASQADLRKYGFPPMPDDARHRWRYQLVFNQMKHKLAHVQPQFRIRPAGVRYTGNLAVQSGPATFASPSTSGVKVVAPQGDSFRWMQGDWVFPNVTAVTPAKEFFCAFWIGIGGTTGTAVLQAGVHFRISQSTHEIWPFWEWIDGTGNGVILDITNFAVGPGDLISVIVCTDEGAGSTGGTLYFFNRTTGSHTSFAVSGPALEASTSEWSVGFPFLWGTDPSILGDYGEVFFSECDAVTNTFNLITSGSGDNFNITSDGTANGTVISESNLITDNIVQCLYLGAVPA